MFKSKNPKTSTVSSVITSKANLSSFTVLSIGIVVAVLLLGGAAFATFVGHVGPLAGVFGYTKDSSANTTPKTDAQKATDQTAATTADHQVAVQQQQTKINTLIAAGDPQSVKQADTVANKQVQAADSSGDDEYIVTAGLAKADLLINTDRVKEAIDSVLMPLLQKYNSNDKYNFRIYSYLGMAYRALGNNDKANSYYDKIPAAEGN